MSPFDVAVDLASGPPKEVVKRLEDPRRKVVQITLREGAVLAEHRALVPILVHCVAGSGRLRVLDDEIQLRPGLVVPVDAQLLHEVTATPAVSFLVVFFRGE